MKQADKDYWYDEKGKVTTDEGSAAVLIVRKGQEITPEIEAKLGKKAADETKAAEPAENKAKSPKANK